MTVADASRPETLIRPMSAADRDAVIALLWELNRYEARLDPNEQPFAYDRDESEAAAIACFERDCERAAQHEGTLVVAERDGAIAGFLCWLVETAEPFVRPEFRRHGYVADLVVAAEQRGSGIGTRLLAEAERLTRERGLRHLAVGVLRGNEPASRVYERFGFKHFATEMMKAID
jgi:ribosomal protein S18 acetylase RimI-like enzyme